MFREYQPAYSPFHLFVVAHVRRIYFRSNNVLLDYFLFSLSPYVRLTYDSVGKNEVVVTNWSDYPEKEKVRLKITACPNVLHRRFVRLKLPQIS